MNPNSIAHLLLDIKAVAFSPERPFTYASGLKGPIYCDNRQIISYVKQREQVCEAFCQKIATLGGDYSSIAGLATGGIPHAAWIAQRLERPMIYIRSKPKGHGKQSQVEGHYQEGDKIVLIEDLVNQGKSLGEALDGVKKANLTVVSCLAIVNYQMEAAKGLLDERQLNFDSLTDFSQLVQASLERKDLNDKQAEQLIAWQKDPKQWSTNFEGNT
jgi:orotate phosphoribosyltransferase